MQIDEITLDPEKIKKARGDRKPSEVAKALGIHRQTLWQIENGKAVPSGETVARMCVLYEVAIKQLIVSGGSVK